MKRKLLFSVVVVSLFGVLGCGRQGMIKTKLAPGVVLENQKPAPGTPSQSIDLPFLGLWKEIRTDEYLPPYDEAAGGKVYRELTIETDKVTASTTCLTDDGQKTEVSVTVPASVGLDYSGQYFVYLKNGDEKRVAASNTDCIAALAPKTFRFDASFAKGVESVTLDSPFDNFENLPLSFARNR